MCAEGFCGEYAQESEALGGSTFTHHLVTGLRGAADASRDGRVTLEEAYAWAWARTIEATFGSVGGVQRPAYSVELSGQGQLVLSEPVAARARLTLDVAAAGRWLVVAASSGMLVAEVDKGDGPVSLALAPGRYVLRLRTARGLLERGVSLAAVGEVVVRGADLERASLVSSARKGDAEGAMAISLGGCVSSGLVRGLSVQPGIELRLRRDAHLAGPLNQFVLSLQGRDGAARDGSFHQTEVELRIGVAHRFVWSRASLATGVELGPLLVAQSLLPNATSRTGLGLAGAAALELRARLSGPVEAHALATAGGALLRTIVSGAVVAPRGGLSLGLVVVFGATGRATSAVRSATSRGYDLLRVSVGARPRPPGPNRGRSPPLRVARVGRCLGSGRGLVSRRPLRGGRAAHLGVGRLLPAG